MNRRTLIAGIAATPALALGSTQPEAAASSSSGYTTLVLAPHQDDEVIRLSGYIAFASDRGDDIHLMTATDGSSTKVRTQLGLTREEITRWRNREQEDAWAWLTNGKGGPISRLGMRDGDASRAIIRDALTSKLNALPGTPELYVATWHHDREGNYIGDVHPDHVACVLAARDVADANGVTVRFARHPLAPGRGARYTASGNQLLRIEGAVAAYTVIGQRSVPTQIRAVLNDPTSRTTP